MNKRPLTKAQFSDSCTRAAEDLFFKNFIGLVGRTEKTDRSTWSPRQILARDAIDQFDQVVREIWTGVFFPYSTVLQHIQKKITEAESSGAKGRLLALRVMAEALENKEPIDVKTQLSSLMSDSQ
jgi:hypothetical protein